MPSCFLESACQTTSDRKVKGQIGKIMLILGEKWVKMQKLVFFCYVIHLSELHRISHFPLKSNIRFRSYGGSKGLFESFHNNSRTKGQTGLVLFTFLFGWSFLVGVTYNLNLTSVTFGDLLYPWRST